MSGERSPDDGRTRGDDEAAPGVHTQLVAGAHLRQGWDALATLLSGVLLFGVPAWWVGERLGWEWLVAVGLVLGTTSGVALAWFRYGVHRS